MPRGIAVTIGLNSVDPKHYQGWSGELNACENDAQDMAQIARHAGFKTTCLLTASATRLTVLDEIKKAAKTLKSGDIFMISYSGHGGQLPDMNDDEPDGQDETWCLYDGEVVDDELYAAWGKFAKGVRILVYSDSCHSGTVTKEVLLRTAMPGPLALRPSPLLAATTPTIYRAMPNDVASRTYRAHREFYNAIQKATKGEKAKEPAASVLLISGCQDNQLSSDGSFNGLFTGTLLRVWKDGAFTGSYKKFRQAIVQRMPPDQTPRYFVVGAPNPGFEAQKPFTI